MSTKWNAIYEIRPIPSFPTSVGLQRASSGVPARRIDEIIKSTAAFLNHREQVKESPVLFTGSCILILAAAAAIFVSASTDDELDETYHTLLLKGPFGLEPSRVHISGRVFDRLVKRSRYERGHPGFTPAGDSLTLEKFREMLQNESHNGGGTGDGVLPVPLNEPKRGNVGPAVNVVEETRQEILDLDKMLRSCRGYPIPERPVYSRRTKERWFAKKEMEKAEKEYQRAKVLCKQRMEASEDDGCVQPTQSM